MLLNKLRGVIPRRSNTKFTLILLALFIASLGFAISFTVAKNNVAKTKSGDIIANGRLENKNGKAVYEVALRSENKDPIDLLIKKGEYVQFNSKDGGQHQIVQGRHGNTEHAKQALDSKVFNGDEGYLIEFKATGKYEFHDNYDHDYTINILVYDPNADTKVQ